MVQVYWPSGRAARRPASACAAALRSSRSRTRPARAERALLRVPVGFVPSEMPSLLLHLAPGQEDGRHILGGLLVPRVLGEPANLTDPDDDVLPFAFDDLSP